MKRTLLKALVLFAAAVSLSACALLRPMSERMADIRTGMSPEQVISIMGKPDLKRFEAGREEWEYQQYIDQSHSSYIVVLVKFTHGTVSGMDSYRVDMPAMPIMPDRNPGGLDKPGKHDNPGNGHGHDGPWDHRPDGPANGPKPDRPGNHRPAVPEAPHPDESGISVHLEWK